MDVEEFRKRAHQMVDYICDYHTALPEQRVAPKVEKGYLRPLLPEAAPQVGENYDDIMKDYEQFIAPGVLHWQHPGFCAFFPSGFSFPSMLGDMLGTMTNTVGFSWNSCPASSELEGVVVDWMAKALGLPSEFLYSSTQGGGVIQGTTSEAILCAMLAARFRALSKRPDDASKSEYTGKLVVYMSELCHPCTLKAANVCGIQHVRSLPVTKESNFAVTGSVARSAMEEDIRNGLVPFFITITVGSTSLCSVDEVVEISEVCRELSVWAHVDSAFAGCSLVCPETRDVFGRGLEYVDSYCFNPHKWLLVNFDCSILWVKDTIALRQALTIDFLFQAKPTNDTRVYDYKDWQIPFGRKFRSLKIWFVMRTYGIQGLQEFIRVGIHNGAELTKNINASEDFELFFPTNSALVSFSLKSKQEKFDQFTQNINEEGKIHVSTTTIHGEKFARVAFGCFSQTKETHEVVWDVLQRHIKAL